MPIQVRRQQRSSTLTPVWRQDWTEFGLTPALKSSLASWTTTSGVTWFGTRLTIADTAGTAQSLAVAFTAPPENYIADVVVQFASSANKLTVSLLSAVAGTVRFSLVIDGAANTIVVNGTDDVTPVGFTATTAHRLRLVVRPGSTDVIAFCYYSNINHKRLKTGGGTKAWTYSGSVGALSLATDTTGTGTIYIQEVETKPILAVIIGDSIATGHDSAANAAGYDPTPYLVNGRSGATHTVKWSIEALTGHAGTIVSQGTGGDTMIDVNTRWTEYVADVLAGMTTKRAIVMAGTNDLAASATAATVGTRLGNVLSAAASSGVAVVVAEVIPRSAFTPTQDGHRTTFNATLPGLSSSTVKIAYTTTNVPALTSPADAADLNTAYSSDGTHLFWSGFKLMGEQAFVPAWEEL